LRHARRLPVHITRHVRDHQEAASGHRTHQLSDEAIRVVVVADQLKYGHQQHRDGLPEIQQRRGPGEDLVRVTGVGVEVPSGALLAALQQGTGVREHDGVVIDIDDPGLGSDRLGDLMGVVRRRQPGADVEKLADARLGRQVADGPHQECPVRAHGRVHIGICPDRLIACHPVHGKVVLAAQPVVVHPGDMRDRGVDLRNDPSIVRDDTALQAIAHESLPPSVPDRLPCEPGHNLPNAGVRRRTRRQASTATRQPVSAGTRQPVSAGTSPRRRRPGPRAPSRSSRA
jgi:hypothetical protein